MDSVIQTYQKADPVELDEVLAKAKELARRHEVLSVEHNEFPMEVRQPNGWWTTKTVTGWQIVYDITGKATGKVPEPRDILAIHNKHHS